VSSPVARPVTPVEGPIDATVDLPGSKSLTNRALVVAALAEGRSRLDGVLFADDTESMLDCLVRLGAGVDVDREGAAVVVDGLGGRGLPPGPIELDARQAGTTARFLLPVLALGPGPYRLDGDEQLRARPMGPGIEAARRLGATVEEVGAAGHLPVDVRGGRAAGDPAVVPVSGDQSSQFLSGLLLAGPMLLGGLRLEVTTPLVSRPYVEMTRAVMAAFGAEVTADGGSYSVASGGYRRADYRIEPDASTASYFLAAAAICGGRVAVAGLGPGSLQGDVGFVDVLERMSASVAWGPEGVAVTGTGRLRGIDADLADLSDTAPTLAVVAAFADTPSRVRGVGFIRRKESDRVAVVVRELRRCGIAAEERPDGFVVHPGRPAPAVFQPNGDHRIAMSFALLGLRVDGVAVADPGCVAKTFPGYWDALDRLGRAEPG
jgi:3-phosphoshikimate 1-carboxyvinyltransferase